MDYGTDKKTDSHPLDNKKTLTIIQNEAYKGGHQTMPVYEYECTQCGELEEVIQKFSDKPLTKCRHCAGKLQKLISQSTFHLKGTGWYVTDYAHKSQGSSAPAPRKAKDKASIPKTDKSIKSAKKDN